MPSLAFLSWEPRANISADDLIEEFERKKLEPQKSKRLKDKKPKTRESAELSGPCQLRVEG